MGSGLDVKIFLLLQAAGVGQGVATLLVGAFYHHFLQSLSDRFLVRQRIPFGIDFYVRQRGKNNLKCLLVFIQYDQRGPLYTGRMTVRVRFAPSPTGHLHVGNVRTALYNWLFACQNSGIFVLRIEDTDVVRSENRFEEDLMGDLRLLGLTWDEGVDVGGEHGPYRQTDRLDLYQNYSQQLLNQEKAYYCFCTSEAIEQERRGG